MSASPLVSNIVTFVNAAQTAKGQLVMYQPDLEFIILQALTEMSTDSLIPSDAQSVLVTQIALAAGDATP